MQTSLAGFPVSNNSPKPRYSSRVCTYVKIIDSLKPIINHNKRQGGQLKFSIFISKSDFQSLGSNARQDYLPASSQSFPCAARGETSLPVRTLFLYPEKRLPCSLPSHIFIAPLAHSKLSSAHSFPHMLTKSSAPAKKQQAQFRPHTVANAALASVFCVVPDAAVPQ